MHPKKKVLFISYDGLTDPLGQSQVIPYLAGLTQYGYEFTIISCDKPANYAAHHKSIENLLEPFSIKWISLPYHKSPPVLSSMYDLYRIKRVIKKLQLHNHFHLVHTRPGLPTLAALWMKKKYGTKFLNDIRGFWADERVDGGMWDLKNPLLARVYRFFKKHEMECLQKADHNTCLTHAAKKEILSWPGVDEKIKIEVIPCSADLALFDASNMDQQHRATLGKKLNINPGDTVISYLGSIGGWYLTAEMMRFFKIFLSKDPSAKFLFISPHRHDVIRKAAQKEMVPLDNIIIVAAQRNEVPALLSLSQYSIFFIKPCYSKLSSSPTKHGEIMAMGIPVITNSGVGDVKEIVAKYEAGFVADDFSDESFNKIADAINTPSPFSTEKICRGADEIYNLKNAVAAYKKIYDSILQSG